MNRTEFLEHLSDVCEVKPETIENFKDSPDTLFNMACEWEGFIGFGESIKEWADGAFGSNICGVDYLDEAIKIDPNYPNAVLTMGLALAQSGKPKEGIPFIEKAGKLGVAQAPMILQMLKNM